MITLKIESIITPWSRMKRDAYCESGNCCSLDKVELGEEYPDFYMIEGLIEDYDVDLTTVKVGDILIRDFQFGHLKNTGYIPVKVVESFDGMNIKVQTADEKIHSICADPYLVKDTVYHKLSKSSLK